MSLAPAFRARFIREAAWDAEHGQPGSPRRPGQLGVRMSGPPAGPGGFARPLVLPQLDLGGLGARDEPPLSESILKRNKLALFERQCSQVAEGLYVSGEAVARSRDALRQHGITHVVNCVGALYGEYFRADGVAYRTLWLQGAGARAGAAGRGGRFRTQQQLRAPRRQQRRGAAPTPLPAAPPSAANPADSPSEDILCILYDTFDFIEQARTGAGPAAAEAAAAATPPAACTPQVPQQQQASQHQTSQHQASQQQASPQQASQHQQQKVPDSRQGQPSSSQVAAAGGGPQSAYASAAGAGTPCTSHAATAAAPGGGGGGRVLVHCSQGVSRSTTVAIAYLMWKLGKPYEEVYQVRGLGRRGGGHRQPLRGCGGWLGRGGGRGGAVPWHAGPAPGSCKAAARAVGGPTRWPRAAQHPLCMAAAAPARARR